MLWHVCNMYVMFVYSCIDDMLSFRRNDHHGRGESGRRRHPSGNRPLSTISDSVDPAYILGLDRSDEVGVRRKKSFVHISKVVLFMLGTFSSFL